MAREPLTLHLSLLLWQAKDGPWQAQLLHCRVEKPPDGDRHRRRRLKSRQYSRSYRDRQKAKAAQAAPTDSPGKERREESVSAVSAKVSAPESQKPPHPSPAASPPPANGPTGPSGNGQARNPTQQRVDEILVELQARKGPTGHPLEQWLNKTLAEQIARQESRGTT
jgi:hypothetical protein